MKLFFQYTIIMRFNPLNPHANYIIPLQELVDVDFT